MTECVGTAGGCVAYNSLHDACTRLKNVCNSFHGNVVAAPLHRRTCHAQVYLHLLWQVWCALKQLSWAPVHTQVCMLHRCFKPLRTHSLQGVHMCSCIRIFFISVEGPGWGLESWPSLWRALVARHWGLFLIEGEIEVLFVTMCLLYHQSFWRRWECMWVYVCAYAHINTQCTWGIWMWPQRSGRDTSRAPDGLNLRMYVFVCVYQVHICIYMIGDGMRLGLMFYNTCNSIKTRPHELSG